MIHYVIKHPVRIESDVVPNYGGGGFDAHLHFVGSDGSRLSVILSEQQVDALMRLEARDPDRMARDLYVSGRIEIDEFERRVGAR